MTAIRDRMFDPALALLAVALSLSLWAVTGTIAINGGQGWDGSDYAAMTLHRWDEGTASTALRPVIALVNRVALAFTDDVVAAYRAMNVVYAALLALGLCALLNRYRASRAEKALIIVNLFLTIAVGKAYAFYPVTVDLGALAVLIWAVLAATSAPPWVAAVAAVIAVLSREFGIAAAAFGIHYALRNGGSWWRVAATYLPAVAVFVAWRGLVAAHWATIEGGEPLGAERVMTLLGAWRDPVFAALFLYFLVTVAGGLSLTVVARAGAAWRALRREPEWLSFAIPVVGAAIVVGADIWRYLVFLLPAVVVLFLACLRDRRRRVNWADAAAILAATVITQRPWQGIDVPLYFREWFPYYIHTGNIPFESPGTLWPLWGWRIGAAVGLVALLAVPFRVRRHAADGPAVPAA